MLAGAPASRPSDLARGPRHPLAARCRRVSGCRRLARSRRAGPVPRGRVSAACLTGVRRAATDLPAVPDPRDGLCLAGDARLVVAHVGGALRLLLRCGEGDVLAALRIEEDEDAQVVAHLIADVDAQRLPVGEVQDRLETRESLSGSPGGRVVARGAGVAGSPVLFNRAVPVVHRQEELAQRLHEALFVGSVPSRGERLGDAPELTNLLVARVDRVDAGLARATERAQHRPRGTRERLGFDEEAPQVGGGALEIDEGGHRFVGELAEPGHCRAQLAEEAGHEPEPAADVILARSRYLGRLAGLADEAGHVVLVALELADVGVGVADQALDRLVLVTEDLERLARLAEARVSSA